MLTAPPDEAGRVGAPRLYAQPTAPLRGRLVQKPEREIDREPELKKPNSLLLGDLNLGRQHQSRAGRRARVHEKVQAPAKQALDLGRRQPLKFCRSHTGLLPCRISRYGSYRFESGTVLSLLLVELARVRDSFRTIQAVA